MGEFSSEDMSEIAEASSGSAIDVSILFVDLVNSSVFSSVLGVEEYAMYVESFQEVCIRQCRFFFEEHLQGKYQAGLHYRFDAVGDELVVFLYTGRPANDVYLLTMLALAIKSAWLGAPFNTFRLENRASSSELACGINFGKVWCKDGPKGRNLIGYAINLAKRIEAESRNGTKFRILLSDRAFKQINANAKLPRNFLFGKRRLVEAKGIVDIQGVYELEDAFVNPVPRLAPEFAKNFLSNVDRAMEANTRDLWIHSLFQVHSDATENGVTDFAMAKCQQVLNYDPENAVALYFLAQAYVERGDLARGEILLLSLTHRWPACGDGFLEYGRLLKRMKREAESERAFLRASMLGVGEEEFQAPLGA